MLTKSMETAEGGLIAIFGPDRLLEVSRRLLELLGVRASAATETQRWTLGSPHSLPRTLERTGAIGGARLVVAETTGLVKFYFGEDPQPSTQWSAALEDLPGGGEIEFGRWGSYRIRAPAERVSEIRENLHRALVEQLAFEVVLHPLYPADWSVFPSESIDPRAFELVGHSPFAARIAADPGESFNLRVFRPAESDLLWGVIPKVVEPFPARKRVGIWPLGPVPRGEHRLLEYVRRERTDSWIPLDPREWIDQRWSKPEIIEPPPATSFFGGGPLSRSAVTEASQVHGSSGYLLRRQAVVSWWPVGPPGRRVLSATEQIALQGPGVALFCQRSQILSCAGAVVGLALLMGKPVEKLPITDDDRALLVTLDDLAALASLEEDPSLAELHKARLFDGSVELKYLYDEGEMGGTYVETLVDIEPDEHSAEGAYAGLHLASGPAAQLISGGFRLEERDDLFSWGDESRHRVLVDERGAVAGHLFTARRGRKIFDFTLIGLGLDDRAALERLLSPKLERLEAYRP